MFMKCCTFMRQQTQEKLNAKGIFHVIIQPNRVLYSTRSAIKNERGNVDCSLLLNNILTARQKYLEVITS